MPMKFSAADSAVAMKNAILMLLLVCGSNFSNRELTMTFTASVLAYTIENFVMLLIPLAECFNVQDRLARYEKIVPVMNPIALATSTLLFICRNVR